MPGEAPLFDVDRHGWLTYGPHDTVALRLPLLLEEAEGATASASLHRLHWPGRLPADADPARDAVPAAVVASWPLRPSSPPVDGRYPIATLIERGLPDELPEALAYHLAVNHARYHVDRPVAGLPARFARLVLERARFHLDARYRGAALHMQWLAESHRAHPLLAGFDTVVRERFMEIGFEAARLFFYALGDRRVGREEGDETHVDLWAELACYLFWVGRSGMGTYADLAGLDPARLDRGARFHELAVGDLIDRLGAWRVALRLAQKHAQAAPR